MLTIKTLATASLEQLRAFAAEHGIVPVGDKRRLDTYRDAIQDFFAAMKEVVTEGVVVAARVADQVAEAVTSKEAKAFYGKVYAAAKVVGKIFIHLMLITIALGMLARDVWQSREEVKASIVTLYHRSICSTQDWLKAQSRKGRDAVRINIIQPVLNHRERIRAMARAAAR
jgi:hypothetical protein